MARPLFLIGLLVWPPTAHAMPPLTLEWSAPPACQEGGAVEAAVNRLVGEHGGAVRTPLSIKAVVEHIGEHWHVTLRSEPGGTPRSLRGLSCAEVVDAATILLALMADPSTLEEPPLVSAPSRSWGLGLWAGAEAGSLPFATGGLALGGSVALTGRLYADLLLVGWLPSTRTLENQGGAAGRVWLFAGTAAVRHGFVLGPFEFGPSLGFDLGWIGAQGFGVSEPGAGSSPWFAARGGVFGSLSLGRVRLSLRLEGAVPLVRPRFVLSEVGEVHAVGWITGRALLGIELPFPAQTSPLPAM